MREENKTLPKTFASLLDKNYIEVEDVLQVNSYKGRYCIVGRKRGEDRKLLIKWNNTHMREHYSKLEKERMIYVLLDGQDITPEFIPIHGFLATDFISGSVTVRSYLIKNRSNPKKTDHMICSVLKDWEKMFRIVNRDFDSNRIQRISLGEQFHLEMYNAWVSKPFDAHSSKILHTCNHVGFWLFTRINAHRIRNMLKSNQLVPVIIHGDYHLNNILVLDERLYTIDFENLCIGYAEIELAYLYVQIWALMVKGKEDVIQRMDQLFCETLEKCNLSVGFFTVCQRILLSQISMNRSFFAQERVDIGLTSKVRLWRDALSVFS